jgi:hypothetical protein
MRPGFSPVVEIILTKTLDNVAAARAAPLRPQPDETTSCPLLRAPAGSTAQRVLWCPSKIRGRPWPVHPTVILDSAERRDHQRARDEQLSCDALLTKFGHLSMNNAPSSCRLVQSRIGAEHAASSRGRVSGDEGGNQPWDYEMMGRGNRIRFKDQDHASHGHGPGKKGFETLEQGRLSVCNHLTVTTPRHTSSLFEAQVPLVQFCLGLGSAASDRFSIDAAS